MCWIQKQSFFNCLLDMAAMDKTNSRAGSLSIDGNHDGNANSQTHLLHGQQQQQHHQQPQQQNGHDHESSLTQLARRNTIRKRSLR